MVLCFVPSSHSSKPLGSMEMGQPGIHMHALLCAFLQDVSSFLSPKTCISELEIAKLFHRHEFRIQVL